MYSAHGDPKDVLALQHLEHATPSASQVLVDFLAV